MVLMRRLAFPLFILALGWIGAKQHSVSDLIETQQFHITEIIIISMSLLILLLLFSFWKIFEESKNETAHYKGILERNNMSIHVYQPPINIRGELDEALNYFASSGHIMLDREGNIVGRLLMTDIK